MWFRNAIFVNQTINVVKIMHPLDLFKYCPKCGSSAFQINCEKSKRCADCGFVYYFNVSSATVAFILNEKGELLVCRRAKEPKLGTLDLAGGFVDRFETGEEGVSREVLEETGLEVIKTEYLFSLPNTYLYSGFLVHTLDQFFLCRVKDNTGLQAMDDVADTFWMPLTEINPEEFGLDSVREGVKIFLKEHNITK
jgi:NADH pyrophosphatase NudC (nudix superfamily)